MLLAGPILFSILAALMVGGIVALAIAGHRQVQQRRADLGSLAAELGLTFSAARDTLHDKHYAHFEIFRQGHSRAAYNTLRGDLTLNGVTHPVRCGDFTYQVTSGSGKDRRTTTHNFSYLIAHLPHPDTPNLLIRPENILDKIGGVFSDRDIDFESEEFSRRFFVASPDRRFAYDICHPRMMEYLLATRPPMIDLEHGRLCLTDAARVWKPEQFRWMISFLGGFLGRWPAHALPEPTPAHAERRNAR